MAEMMKAAVIRQAGGPDALRIEDLPRPAPRPGEILIQVRAFGLNRSELFTRQGHSPNVTFPRILGIEAVGVETEGDHAIEADTVVLACGVWSRHLAATAGVAIPEGEEILDRPTEKRARVLATLTEAQGVVAFRHSPYPEVMQPLPAPVPGGNSESLRVLESRYVAGALNVRVEGLPGRPYRFNVATPWPIRVATGPRGTRLVTPGPGRATVELRIPGSGTEYRRADVTLEFRR